MFGLYNDESHSSLKLWFPLVIPRLFASTLLWPTMVATLVVWWCRHGLIPPCPPFFPPVVGSPAWGGNDVVVHELRTKPLPDSCVGVNNGGAFGCRFPPLRCCRGARSSRWKPNSGSSEVWGQHFQCRVLHGGIALVVLYTSTHCLYGVYFYGLNMKRFADQ